MSKNTKTFGQVMELTHDFTETFLILLGMLAPGQLKEVLRNAGYHARLVVTQLSVKLSPEQIFEDLLEAGFSGEEATEALYAFSPLSPATDSGQIARCYLTLKQDESDDIGAAVRLLRMIRGSCSSDQMADLIKFMRGKCFSDVVIALCFKAAGYCPFTFYRLIADPQSKCYLPPKKRGMAFSAAWAEKTAMIEAALDYHRPRQCISSERWSESELADIGQVLGGAAIELSADTIAYLRHYFTPFEIGRLSRLGDL